MSEFTMVAPKRVKAAGTALHASRSLQREGLKA
jgi:hypothetical protein